MKRVIVCILISSFTVIFSICGLLHFKSCTKSFSDQLLEIESLYSNGETEKAVKAAEDTEKYWNEKSGFIAFYLDHNFVLEISSSLSKIIGFLKADSEEIYGECRNLTAYLDYVYKTQIPNFQNIF